MPVLFQSKPGTVVRLLDPSLQCSTRFLDIGPNSGAQSSEDVELSFDTEKSIVTRLTLSSQVNLQFLHSLGEHIYIYVFGDRIGSLNLSGLSFQCGCPDDGALGGADLMLQWYKKHRASRRQAPVEVTVGTQVIEGFVTGFTEDVVDPSLNLVQWGVTLASLPEDD